MRLRIESPNKLGALLESAKAEVSTSIRRLFYWAAYADKYGEKSKHLSMVQL